MPLVEGAILQDCVLPLWHARTPQGREEVCQWKDLSMAEAREKGLRVATDTLLAEN
jgi:hypothetical protein